MSIWARWKTWAKWGEAGTAAATYSISGTINDSAGAGLDGVTVTLTGDASDSTVTAGGGAYEFTGLDPGSYTVTPTKSGSTFNPTSAAVTIVATNKTATTMAQVWQITGQILDSAGAGLSGVLCTLTGDASDTDTTDGSGNYSFPTLSDGSYTVTPTKAGSTFNPTSRASTISGADDAVSSMAQVWQITGNIVDDAAANLPGVLVTLSGDASDTDTTDGSGNYSFPNLADGSYTVTPSKAGKATWTPASSAETVSGADETADFAGSNFPSVENFEADTIGETEATLEAKDTHADIWGSGITVRAIDYGTLPAIKDNDFAQCLSCLGTAGGGFNSVVADGLGFTPSDGRVFLMEGVFYTAGTGSQIEMYARDSDNSDGILAVMTGTQFLLDTLHSGNTRKITIGTTLASTPHGTCWFYFGCQYNHSNDNVHFRVIEFGLTGATQEDTGWVFGGAITPTFDDSEWVNFQVISKSNTTADQGIAQLRVADQIVDGYGYGANETATYRAP